MPVPFFLPLPKQWGILAAKTRTDATFSLRQVVRTQKAGNSRTNRNSLKLSGKAVVFALSPGKACRNSGSLLFWPFCPGRGHHAMGRWEWGQGVRLEEPEPFLSERHSLSLGARQATGLQFPAVGLIPTRTCWVVWNHLRNCYKSTHPEWQVFHYGPLEFLFKIRRFEISNANINVEALTSWININR